MKIVFLTNQPSYYQMHFARAMANELGEENFRIVFHKGTSSDREEMGWQDEYKESFIIRYAESEQEQAHCLRWIETADVVIQGRFPIQFVKKRIQSGKLTFACQERLWKKSPSWTRKISRLAYLYKNYYSVNKPNYHFLSIGAFAAKDMLALGVFKKRCWQYGYFIDCPKLQPKPERERIELLWCGRFCEFKQPHKAVELLNAIRDQNVSAHLTMIGDGELKQQIEKFSYTLGIADQISFLGWQNQQQIYHQMQNADLFLMTSHQGEGWGLVVNEAMSNGCAVVANQALGSASVLIEHGKSGFLYKDDDLLTVAKLIANTNNQQLRSMGKNAHATMLHSWSAECAAQRTIMLAEQLSKGDIAVEKSMFSSGVCAPIE